MLKHSGRGHDLGGTAATKPGTCAVLCPACLQPSINLPDGWRDAAPGDRYLYSLFIAIDANFHLKHKNVSTDFADPGLSEGWSYFLPEKQFKDFLHDFDKLIIQEVTPAQDLNISTGFEGTHVHQSLNDDAHMAAAGDDNMTISHEVAQLHDIVTATEENKTIPSPSDDETMTINQQLDIENEICEVEQTSMAEEDHQPPLQEAVEVVQKLRKRARKSQYNVSFYARTNCVFPYLTPRQAHDPRRFLDMEAEVSHDEEGEGTGDEALDDFINDDSSESGDEVLFFVGDSKASLPPNNIKDALDPREDEWRSEEEILDWDNDPAITSHDEVFQLMSTEEANYAWQSYLEEDHQREHEERDRECYPYDRHWYPDPVPETVPTELIPDSIIPLIPRLSHDKFLWCVAVKCGREEALTFILYSKAMQGNFKVKSIVGRVPHEQAISPLKETPFSYCKGGDWVCVMEPKLYCGDLGWVLKAVCGLSMNILVIPRLVFPPPPHKRKAKGKQKADVPKKKPLRPPQHLINMKSMIALGEPHITNANHWVHAPDIAQHPKNSEKRCIRSRREYVNGFAVLITCNYVPTIPKRHELDIFKELTIISPSVIVSTEELLDALRFSVDDPIKVIRGQAAGAIGRIAEVDHGQSIATVAPHQVAFYEPLKTIYTQTAPDTRQAPKDFHFSKMTVQDVVPAPSVELPPLHIKNPHQRFVGRQVAIIHGPFKDYRGVVKNTEQGDLVNVELQVLSMIQHQFNLKDLAHVDDPYLRPLSTFAGSLAPLPTCKPLEGLQELTLPSAMPLVPSTPIPEGSSAAMGHAWNPSARTPNTTSAFSCNPWMQSLKLKLDLRVSVKIQGTMPVLKDPGWKYGDLEGMPAVWKKEEQDTGELTVWVGLKRQRVPEQYIVPLTLNMKGQHVIIINSSDDRYCQDFIVVNYDPETR
ncbi:hypothetical protein H0H92_003016 [Tricholoma furcatifolium]|nr:hypothetical protein H0H92_003016 [Tricholoma furcatifolium]